MKTIAAAAVVAAAACEGPGGAETVYRLERTLVDTLPYVLRVEEGCLHLLRGGDVVFYGNGRYRSSFDVEKKCGEDDYEDIPVEGVDGLVRVERDTAFFSDSAGVSKGFGVLTSDSLVVRGPLHTLIYRRQSR